MMNDYLKNITPDSFSGIVFAFEGIKNVITLVNGPSGCKFYHSATADYQTIKQSEFDPLNFPEKWYFGQPRVPCTYLDTKDYVYGSNDKLEEAISFLKENVEHDLLCVVNSPGAALIGDNLNDIILQNTDKPFIAIESPGFSSSICDGFDNAFVQLIKQLKLKKKHINTSTVNILGLSIFHKNYLGDILELKRLFSLCGINVNCFLGSECDYQNICEIPNVELNIVLHPEYGIKTAQLLKEKFDTPYYVSSSLPIGFSATEQFFNEICNMLGKDCSKLMIESEKTRAKVFPYISRVNSLTGLPKSVLYSIEGEYSLVYSYISFLSSYFGMIIDSVSILNSENNLCKEKLDCLLYQLNRMEAYDIDILDNNSELFFGNGNTIAKLKMLNKEFSGFEISLPTLGYIDIIEKTHLGLQGALHISEQVLNGLVFK